MLALITPGRTGGLGLGAQGGFDAPGGTALHDFGGACGISHHPLPHHPALRNSASNSAPTSATVMPSDIFRSMIWRGLARRGECRAQSATDNIGYSPAGVTLHARSAPRRSGSRFRGCGVYLDAVVKPRPQHQPPRMAGNRRGEDGAVVWRIAAEDSLPGAQPPGQLNGGAESSRMDLSRLTRPAPVFQKTIQSRRRACPQTSGHLQVAGPET